MGFSEKVTQATEIAKFIANQKMRLYEVRNRIKELENSVLLNKSELAETSLRLYRSDKLLNQDLINICNRIKILADEIKKEKDLLENIKAESPPTPQDIPTTYSSEIGEVTSGLVCPICGQALSRSHCPEHGKKGVPIEDNEQEESIPEVLSDMQPVLVEDSD